MIIIADNVKEVRLHSHMRRVDLTGPEGNVFNLLGICREHYGEEFPFDPFEMRYDEIVEELVS